MKCVVGRITNTQSYPSPTPRTCECVMLHGKGKLRLQMELRLIINWRDYSGLSRWVNDTPRVHKRGAERKKNQNHRDDVGRKAQTALAGVKDGMEPLAKECQQPLEARKCKKTDSPPEFC